MLIIIATGGGDFTGQPPAVLRLQQEAQLVAALLRMQLHHVDAEQLVLGDPQRLLAGRSEDLQRDVVKGRYVPLLIEPDHPRIELLQLVLECLVTTILRRRRVGVFKRFHPGLLPLKAVVALWRLFFVVCLFRNSRKFWSRSRRQTCHSGILLELLRCIVKWSFVGPRGRSLAHDGRVGPTRVSCPFSVNWRTRTAVREIALNDGARM